MEKWTYFNVENNDTKMEKCLNPFFNTAYVTFNPIRKKSSPNILFEGFLAYVFIEYKCHI